MKYSPPGSDAHFPPPLPPPPAASLRGRDLGSLSPGAAALLSPLLPPREEEEENRGPGGAGPSVPATIREEAGAQGRAGSQESRLSLVGGRRGSIGSRSASAGQTSGPALLGRGLRIGWAGGRQRGRRRRRRSLRSEEAVAWAGSSYRPGSRLAVDAGAQRGSLQARRKGARAHGRRDEVPGQCPGLRLQAPARAGRAPGPAEPEPRPSSPPAKPGTEPLSRPG